MKFLFALDIGNTDINIALVTNLKIIRIHKVKTIDFKKNKSFRFLFKPFLQFMKKNNKKYRIYIIVSSVVPELDQYICNLCNTFFDQRLIFVSDKIKLDMMIDLKNKKDVGSDRLLNAVAVNKIYKYPAIIVDFGTATTFDIIDKNGNYSGGLITPGIKLSLESLYYRTSKLPLVNFKKVKKVIGKSTVSAIESGLYWGYVGMVSFLIKKIKLNYHYNFFCISTGGFAKIISNDIKEINKVDENLTILGLIEVFKLNCNE